MAAAVTRRLTVTETTAPSIVVPKGRTVAERRLSAIAALHQPVARVYPADLLYRQQEEVVYVCTECKASNDVGRTVPARWPCTTAKLLGPWPGEVTE